MDAVVETCLNCGSPLTEPRKLKEFCNYSCRGQHSVKALDGPKYRGAYLGSKNTRRTKALQRLRKASIASVLEEERQLDLSKFPDRYHHVWEGDYAKAFEGAYFATGLAEARRQGRVGKVAADPLLPLRLYWDIGGAGAKADACAVWVVQFVAQEIRVLDYIEGQGQVLGYYTQELHHRGYDKALCTLPHDGMNANAITGLKYADHLRDAGFSVNVVPNQGASAAAQRIEAVRRLLPKCWFNETTTEAGRDALGFYHEKKDEQRDVGLGPEHDWSSHAADAFGLMAIAYEEPSRKARFNRKLEYPQLGIV